MISVAIKNSLILALVILIAHFLLKNTGDERQHESNTPTPESRRTVASNPESPPPDAVFQDASSRTEDLFSYVYGPSDGATAHSDPPLPQPSSSATLDPSTAPSTAPSKPTPVSASASASDEGVTGYEGGLSDQWCMV